MVRRYQGLCGNAKPDPVIAVVLLPGLARTL